MSNPDILDNESGVMHLECIQTNNSKIFITIF